MRPAGEKRAREHTSRALAIAASALAFAVSGCAALPRHSDDPAPIVRGPIPARIQGPLDLTWLAFRPRSVATQAEGTRTATWTSA